MFDILREDRIVCCYMELVQIKIESKVSNIITEILYKNSSKPAFSHLIISF